MIEREGVFGVTSAFEVVCRGEDPLIVFVENLGAGGLIMKKTGLQCQPFRIGSSDHAGAYVVELDCFREPVQLEVDDVDTDYGERVEESKLMERLSYGVGVILVGSPRVLSLNGNGNKAVHIAPKALFHGETGQLLWVDRETRKMIDGIRRYVAQAYTIPACG